MARHVTLGVSSERPKPGHVPRLASPAWRWPACDSRALSLLACPLLCRRPGVLRVGRWAARRGTHPIMTHIAQGRDPMFRPLAKTVAGALPILCLASTLAFAQAGGGAPGSPGVPGSAGPRPSTPGTPGMPGTLPSTPGQATPGETLSRPGGPDPTNPAQRALSRLARLLCQRRVASGNCGSKARRRGRRPAPSRSNGPGSRRPAAPVRASRMSPCRPGLRPGNGGVLLWDGPSRRVRGSGPTRLDHPL